MINISNQIIILLCALQRMIIFLALYAFGKKEKLTFKQKLRQGQPSNNFFLYSTLLTRQKAPDIHKIMKLLKRKDIFTIQQLSQTPLLCILIVIYFEMLKNNSDGSYRNLSKSKARPKSSVTKRSIDIYAEAVPLHRRIKHAYHISSITNIPKNNQSFHKQNFKSSAKLDSDQPEAVYSWLDQFQSSITKKQKGTPFDYPVAKYQQSVRLVDSKGYKNVKNMQKLEKLPRFVKVMRDELKKIHEKYEYTEQANMLSKTAK